MRTQQALYVPNGENRSEEELQIWGVIPLQIKVSTDDTDGARRSLRLRARRHE